MATPQRRSAVRFFWQAPNSESFELTPLQGGLLEIELQDDLVAVHSRKCSLVSGDEETILAEYEFSLPLHRCQIEWSRLEQTKSESIEERSAYFQQ